MTTLRRDRYRGGLKEKVRTVLNMDKNARGCVLRKGDMEVMHDFLSSLHCVRQEELPDYRSMLDAWNRKDCHIAFMPAISWYGGTYNLFDQKAGPEGKNMIWIIPAGQNDSDWLSLLNEAFVNFYEKDETDFCDTSCFPGIEAEAFEECILLHSDDLQDDPEKQILDANVIAVRLSLSSGRETLLVILLDHQDTCWKKVVEGYRIPLTWFVDSGRWTEDYYVYTELYQLMEQTAFPDLLPPLYFKGRYNKGAIPRGFRFLYAMLSQPDADGYDPWRTFSAVYETAWRAR